MPRIRTLLLGLAALALVLPLAYANPLDNIKQTARDTRDTADQQQAQVQAEAEGREHRETADASDDHARRAVNKGTHHDHPHAEGLDHDHAEGHDHAHAHGEKHEHGQQPVEVHHAVAVMFPTEGNDVRGTIRFDQVEDGVRVTAEISGLTPHAKHGFHVHEFGDLSDPAGKATGGHYNPEGHDHSLPPETYGERGQAERHAGDLGNLQADGDGNAVFSETFDNLSIFDPTKNPVLGRGMIIHAQPDDGGQPTGNAGARIAQGVIGVAAE
jgi:Cu-Zn family superoxide dismutase